MKAAIAIIAIIVLAVAVWWQVSFPSGSWRYKMTVTVETPEGVKTGFAVREVTVISVPQLTPEMKPTVKLKGEAVVVDLGKRGLLFALLKGNKLGESHARNLPFYAFPYEKGGTTKSGIRHYSRLKAVSAELEPELYPTFVHFRDLQTHTETLYDAMFRAANHYSVQGTEEGLSAIFNSSAAEWKRSIAVPRRMPRH